MIIIFTSKRDSHVDLVAQHLDAAGRSWVRINTEDFARNAEMDINPSSGTGRIFLRDSGRQIDLDQVTACWYRKPDPVDIHHFEIGDPQALEYVEAEFTENISGIYALLRRAVWINDPMVTRLAHRKMLQLQIAARVGFSVPRTLVSKRPDSALKFASSIGRDIAIKSLGAVSVTSRGGGEDVTQYGMFTRRLTEDELRTHIDQVKYMPTLFQEFVRKDAELRITCAGDQIFACEIRARPSDLTADDSRFDIEGLPHRAVEVPELHDRLRAYMQAFGVNFGCFDFLVPEGGGVPVFLEMNPNGQWAWVQKRTGQDIGRAVADLLLSSNA